MTARRRQANRANAKLSTGPKSDSGKLSSSQNALKHGLSQLTHPADPKVTDLAHLLIDEADELSLPLALEAARCVVEYERVQRAYQIAYEQLNEPTNLPPGRGAGEEESVTLNDGKDPPSPSSASFSQLAKTIDRLGRYERRAFSRRKKALQALVGVVSERR